MTDKNSKLSVKLINHNKPVWSSDYRGTCASNPLAWVRVQSTFKQSLTMRPSPVISAMVKHTIMYKAIWILGHNQLIQILNRE